MILKEILQFLNIFNYIYFILIFFFLLYRISRNSKDDFSSQNMKNYTFWIPCMVILFYISL